MGTDPYHRQPQNVQIEAMDLGETLTHQETLPPDFAQAALVNGHLSSMGSSQAMQETIPVFADMGDPSAMITSNHVPLSDAPANATFMTPMDVVQQPPIPDNVYIPANVPLNDPYSMITPVDSPMVLETNQVSHPSGMQPATHIQASTLVDAMQTGMNPMLDSTLMPQVAPVTQMQMNPAMPSMAPSFINPAVPNLPPTMTPPQEEVTPEALNNALSGMLFEIENTAKHARQALSDKEDVTGSKVNRVLTSPLKDCISQMFTNLLTISSALESSTYTPPLQSPSIVLEQKESPLSLPSTSSSASSPMEVPTENRKRSASGLDDDRRSVKSLKRESPDSVALTAPYAEPSSSALDGSQSFPITKLSLHANGSQTVLPLGSPTSVSSQSSFATRGFAQGTPLPPTPTFPSFNGVPMASPIESSLSLSHGSIAPLFPGIQTAWSDSVVPTRHQHSSSLESLPGAQLQVPTSDPVTPAIPDALSGFMPQGASQPATPPNPVPIGVPIGRMSRSGSITGTFTPFTFAASLDNASEPGSLWANSLSRVPGNPPVQKSPPVWNNGVEKAGSSLSPSPVSDRINLAAPPAAVNRTSPPTADEDEDDEGDSDDEDSGGKHSRMSDGSHPSSANDVPMEYRAEVERIFFDFLNGICSNLDATDSKGEPIHQTLMAKKMQRLDESPDFRPFKFRIQAFTHAFLEELAKYGYTDDKIPMKKVRNFLWRSPYILRFNEDGKKAKSKGNHIWNIEAKKVGEGKWEFRPFQRKLAGTPPSIAYCGLKWSWSPHVWDPQASLSNAPVEYSSPVLPHWLSWNRNVLSGTPPPDAESCQITVNAKFVVDGQDCSLSHTFNLTIAPVKSIENQSIARSRRPSLVNEAPRRTASDSVLFQTVQRAKPRPAPSSADNRVIRVLQSVAQRVTEEAATQSIVASQSIVNSPPEQEELQVLEKQKIVLDQSVNAFDKALSGTTVVADRRLAVAAQNVVVQAAHSVLADRSIAGGGVPVKHPEAVAVKNVTVSELSEATQDAIALAVKQEGPASSGVDIMVAATTILKLRTAGSSSENLAALAAHPPAVPARPLSGSAKRLSKISAHPLSSVTEYVA